MKALLVTSLLLSSTAMAQSPTIQGPQGQYLGNLNQNQYDPNSVANPMGRYGSPMSTDSINNPQSRWGNPMSPDSVTNPYGRGPTMGTRPTSPIQPTRPSWR